MPALGKHQDSPMFRLRSQFELSQPKFAKLIGMSLFSVRKAERNKSPVSPQTKKVVELLIKIAKLEEQLEK